jgi:hypothetical protein
VRQFNFARNWRKKIMPLLRKQSVEVALNFGMLLQGDDFKPGGAPWLHGRGPMNGQRAKEGSLSWYQPWGRCHYIAPFSWAIGRELFPKLQWGFITSDTHTVAIGYEEYWRHPMLVMDILLFQEKTAQESLDFAKGHGWKFYRSLQQYGASFYTDPEYALKIIEKVMS